MPRVDPLFLVAKSLCLLVLVVTRDARRGELESARRLAGSRESAQAVELAPKQRFGLSLFELLDELNDRLVATATDLGKVPGAPEPRPLRNPTSLDRAGARVPGRIPGVP